MALSGVEKHAWWKESVIYQIYPASFQDSNGDGWGDIPGITSRLDYLKDLGIDIVWVSPIYKSPQADMGYDISDYKDIDHRYGTLEDVDRLIQELKRREMKLMMDLVVNHTSNEHAWFLESKASKSSPKRDWYIWKPPKSFAADDTPEPPNNWSQILGEANSAWTYSEETKEFYLSLFTPEQPDLNWENPEVREAVVDVMKFWMDRGACGFRMDVINLISKVQTFPDADPVLGPDHKYHPGHAFYVNGPKLHEYLEELNQKVLRQYDSITVGEMPGVNDIDEIIRTVGSHNKELRMIFIFDLVDIDNVPGKVRMTLQPWSPKKLKQIISKWQRSMIERDGWNSVFVENHDNPRSVSRYCDDSDDFRDKGSKLLSLMETTLGGTLYVYQGEEIGMRNLARSWDPSEYKDIESINFWKKCQDLYPGNDAKLEEGRAILHAKARDHARYPMQWSAHENAGFCSKEAKPWMRINEDYTTINAEVQMTASEEGELSVWQFWQRGLRNRKVHKDAFVYGDYQELDSDSEDIFAYVRSGEEGSKWLIVLNWTGKRVKWSWNQDIIVEAWVASTYTKGKPEKPTTGTITLEAWEGILGKCK
ncbi:MAG: hypothetical protein Q9227_005969 [Pyrenula ochraceoflavens]